jgi:hypothetical protein
MCCATYGVETKNQYRSRDRNDTEVKMILGKISKKSDIIIKKLAIYSKFNSKDLLERTGSDKDG